MFPTHRLIQPGDLVIVWMTRENLHPLIVTPGEALNNRFGHFKHADMVNLPFGSKMPSKNQRGFIHLLRPTPELWTHALPHRTQILYLPDTAFIVSHLDIRPGSRVIEAGTGSGSFTHSVARTVGSKGRVWTFEYHESRAEKARAEFASHNMLDRVVPAHRDVCKDGFGGIENEADAVFLDLPMPWEAIPEAKRALRTDRISRICCFSPCIEQVLRTVSALNLHGFSEITMYEILSRSHEVLYAPVPSVLDAKARLREVEERKEARRQAQMVESERRRAGGAGEKRKRDEEDGEASPAPSTGAEGEGGRGRKAGGGGGGRKAAEALAADPKNRLVSRPFAETRGHTSYLTFASLLPYAAAGAPSPLPSPSPSPPPVPAFASPPTPAPAPAPAPQAPTTGSGCAEAGEAREPNSTFDTSASFERAVWSVPQTELDRLADAGAGAGEGQREGEEA